MDIITHPMIFIYAFLFAALGSGVAFWLAGGYLDPAILEMYGSLGMLLLGINPNASAVNPASHPVRHAIVRNYPNPFNPETTIEYRVNEASHVSVQIFDLKGRLLQTAADTYQTPGTYTFKFEGQDLPSGIYVVQVRTGTQAITRKMMLVR